MEEFHDEPTKMAKPVYRVGIGPRANQSCKGSAARDNSIVPARCGIFGDSVRLGQRGMERLPRFFGDRISFGSDGRRVRSQIAGRHSPSETREADERRIHAHHHAFRFGAEEGRSQKRHCCSGKIYPTIPLTGRELDPVYPVVDRIAVTGTSGAASGPLKRAIWKRGCLL